jgi:hypothetical protein
VFDGFDGRTILPEHSRVVDRRDVFDRRRYFNTDIGAPEDDAAVRWCRFQGQRNFIARM